MRSGSDPIAIEAEGISVRYRTTQERARTLRHALKSFPRRSLKPRYVQALRDVSFKVPTGSVYGVIGPNGAGKSTLFRVLAGTLAPDEGRVKLVGQVTPLLSLGLGFNRQLTGRENILLGGLAYGLPRERVLEQRDAIIEFTELGDAIDSPMRTYSSGMFARLAFSVAAFLDPDVILIDEALSAGDASFKSKTVEKIDELCESDCTVMIVTHGLGMVTQRAHRCLWLDQGRVRLEGSPDEVVDAYLAELGVEGDGVSMDDL